MVLQVCCLVHDLQAARLRGRRASPLIKLTDLSFVAILQLDDAVLGAVGLKGWGLGLECGHLLVYLSNLLIEDSQLAHTSLILVALEVEQTRTLYFGWPLN